MNILDTLTENEKNCIKTKLYKKGKVVFSEDEICENVGVVNEGAIEIASFLSDGNKIIFNTIEKDGMFGNNLIFSSSPFYKGDVTAICDSNISLISKNDLVKLLQNNKDFLIKYLTIESDFAKMLNHKIKLSNIASAEERIMFAIESNGGKVKIKSITNFAENIGLKRETVSRILNRLKKEGEISFSSKIISKK